jgi:hypothetical protein
MLSRADSKLGTSDAAPEQLDDAGVEATHTLMRFVLWLLRGNADGQIPVRVFYKFDSGRWRCRSTRQLHKVYRCR